MPIGPRWQLELHSDGLLLLLGPTGFADPSDPSALDGGTCTGRLLSNTIRSRVAADGDVNGTDVTVEDGSLFTAGDTCHMMRDDKSHVLLTVDSVADNVVTLSTMGAGRFCPAKDWNFLSFQFGSDISMTTYGTPLASGNLWGYSGLVDYDLDLLLADDLRAEVDFNGGSGLRKYVTLESIKVVAAGG